MKYKAHLETKTNICNYANQSCIFFCKTPLGIEKK